MIMLQYFTQCHFSLHTFSIHVSTLLQFNVVLFLTLTYAVYFVEFGHIVEIYNFSPELKTQDLMQALSSFR